MAEILSFDEAVLGLRDFLSTEGHPDQVVWAFREDFYSEGSAHHRVVWPLSPENDPHARLLYTSGQRRGLVGLEALFRVAELTVATVVAPQADEIQGWSGGLKLSVRLPFVAATPVPAGFVWLLHRARTSYRRHQRLETFVAKRGQVAA